MKLDRTSGILLHPTSLPSGRLDADAYGFVDWLAAAGQSWWQVLPLGPPDRYGTPYRAASAFAAWPGLLAGPDAPVTAGELESFVARHPFWAGHWAAFVGAGALADQVRFEREWCALRRYAAERGVRLIGDVPIYVADNGADRAAWPELFAAGEVAGAPPDALSASGQAWGNPLYDWRALRSLGYRWWIERFRRVLELVDVVRVDHFRGFVAYWAVPEGSETATNGRWRPGPGAAPFVAAEAVLGPLPVIAENLGVITPPVERLRRSLGFPGMVVLLWAFGGARDNPHRLENHEERQVVYTGTHDTDTVVGWNQKTRTLVDPEPHWRVIELAMTSRAALAIVQAQDVLGLGSEARMNQPGRPRGNWRWRLEPGALTPELAARLREATERGGRACSKVAARRGSSTRTR
jgi:4-alpha-glucanotransferase